MRTSQVESVSCLAHLDCLRHTLPIAVLKFIEAMERAQFPSVQRRESKAVVGRVDRDFVIVVTGENHKVRIVWRAG